MKFVKNVFDWFENDDINDGDGTTSEPKEFIIIDIFEVSRCYACGNETKPDMFHPTLHKCESGHVVEIPCTDWLIVFTFREKREIKIRKNKPAGKTSIGRGSWIPESETDTALKFNEQLLRFDYEHELNPNELFGVYFTDLVNALH
jgi:hypothetical protein